MPFDVDGVDRGKVRCEYVPVVFFRERKEGSTTTTTTTRRGGVSTRAVRKDGHCRQAKQTRRTERHETTVQAGKRKPTLGRDHTSLRSTYFLGDLYAHPAIVQVCKTISMPCAFALCFLRLEGAFEE